MRPLEEESDEALLAEVWRRFGENWCSFSSGVRSREECPICRKEGALTRHHLTPVAQGAGRERSVKARYVKLCRACHDLAHRVWGPGHHYDGPPDREIFLARLREHHD
jgi:hypothetical protein